VSQSEGQSNESPEAARTFNRESRRALAAYERETRSLAKPKYDPDLTADRFALAHAVRGASGDMPPEPQKNYGDLNETDFRREVDREMAKTARR